MGIVVHRESEAVPFPVKDCASAELAHDSGSV